MYTYGARWSIGLVVTSCVATTACVAAGAGAGGSLFLSGRTGLAAGLWVFLAIILGAALFTIRGYTVFPRVLLVHRLFWATRLSLDGLRSVSFEPGVMRWALRTFGNGGFFSFSGWYWNRQLGSFRAFVTDPKRAVVLRLTERRIVISPDLPEQFVADIWNAQGGPK